MLKPNFTINEIGKFRFYSGLIIGVLYSVILNQLFRFTTKLSNVATFWDIDNWITRTEFKLDRYYLFLIGFTSISFAFCFTTYLWLSKPIILDKRRKRQSRFGQTNSIFIFGFTLMFLTKLLSFWIGTGLSFKSDFGLLPFLLPIFLYLYCWSLIQKIYKLKKIFIISMLVYIIMGSILTLNLNVW